MPKISELESNLGRNTASPDLFVMVDVSEGSSGTKKITRQELVRALSLETFYDIELQSPDVINPSIILSDIYEGEDRQDYIPITNHQTNQTYRFSVEGLLGLLSGASSSFGAYYVDSTVGDDDLNTGIATSPYKTIQKALSEATSGVKKLIIVASGIYEINEMLSVPDDVAIVSLGGSNNTTINSSADFIFAMGSGSQLRGFSVTGQTMTAIYNEFGYIPTSGFVAKFRTNASISRPPILNDIVQRSGFDTNQTKPSSPNDMNVLNRKGGGMLFADASVLSANSTFSSFIVDGCQLMSPNGVGYYAERTASIYVINSHSRFLHLDYLARNGGRIITQSCSTHFGDYTARAVGSTNLVEPSLIAETLSAKVAKATEILSNISNIHSGIDNFITSSAFGSGSIISTQSKKLLDVLVADLYAGSQIGVRSYAMSLFNNVGNHKIFGNETVRTNAIATFNQLPVIIGSVISLNSGETTHIQRLVQLVTETIFSPMTKARSSSVEIIGHSFMFVGAGVSVEQTTHASLLGGGKNAPRTIQKFDGGVVRFTGQDHLNNFYLPNNNSIDGRSGRSNGRAFKTQAKIFARRYSNSRSSGTW